MPQQFTSAEAALRFIQAGRAFITLTSLKTSKHFTYRIKQATDEEGNRQMVWFVGLLIEGNADDGSFSYLGMLKANAFSLTKKSQMGEDALSVRAFRYFWNHLIAGAIAPQLKVQHEGKCGRCGRTLTHPESIDLGIGPECASVMGITRHGELGSNIVRLPI